MSRTTAVILVIGFLAFYLYFDWRFDRLERLLEVPSVEVSKGPKKALSETQPVPKKDTPIKKVARPSKNPNADVTGASARTQRRRARVSDCKRACRQFVSCISSAGFCTALTTDGQESASRSCTSLSEKDTQVRSKLMARTGCGEKAIADLPQGLQFLCVQ